MGRNAQPVELIKAKGKSNHLTKAEIAARKAAEVKLGASDLSKVQPPTFVKNDVTAFNHWKQHMKEYKDAAKAGIEVLTTADIGQLALYCKTFSEYEGLLTVKSRVTEETTLDDILKLETAVNKKMDMLIKMQDRLFLNPLARVKNVPKREQKKPDNPMEQEFDV
jgi:phage terminase small subunit